VESYWKVPIFVAGGELWLFSFMIITKYKVRQMNTAIIPVLMPPRRIISFEKGNISGIIGI